MPKRSTRTPAKKAAADIEVETPATARRSGRSSRKAAEEEEVSASEQPVAKTPKPARKAAAKTPAKGTKRKAVDSSADEVEEGSDSEGSSSEPPVAQTPAKPTRKAPSRTPAKGTKRKAVELNPGESEEGSDNEGTGSDGPPAVVAKTPAKRARASAAPTKAPATSRKQKKEASATIVEETVGEDVVTVVTLVETSEVVTEELAEADTAAEVREKPFTRGKAAKKGKGRAESPVTDPAADDPMETEGVHSSDERAPTVVASQWSGSPAKPSILPVPVPASSPASGSGSSSKELLAARLAKLQKLKSLRNESQRANLEDVKTEFRKSKENPKDDERQERKREKAERGLAKQTAEMTGDDYQRQRSMAYSIEDVERWEEKEAAKELNADKGFSDYGQAQARKYNKLIRDMKPNVGEYQEQKAAHAESGAPDNAFYRDADSLSYANPEHRATREAAQRLVEDLQKQLSAINMRLVVNSNEKRKQFSRRREHNEDEDVTYINERNMQFNKKIARAYDKYTAEIKGNFERGTAL
ncbi:pre-mRNA-splicing factor syf2 [Thoreauomyces humboldtii]|nr:pre-mRNA-splicing factor syf2 [Thoreauomyces humboldtii]